MSRLIPASRLQKLLEGVSKNNSNVISKEFVKSRLTDLIESAVEPPYLDELYKLQSLVRDYRSAYEMMKNADLETLLGQSRALPNARNALFEAVE